MVNSVAATCIKKQNKKPGLFFLGKRKRRIYNFHLRRGASRLLPRAAKVRSKAGAEPCLTPQAALLSCDVTTAVF